MAQEKGRFDKAISWGTKGGIVGLIVGLAIALRFIGPGTEESILRTTLLIQIPVALMTTAGSWLIGFALGCPTPIFQGDTQENTDAQRGMMLGVGLWMMAGTFIAVFYFRPHDPLDINATFLAIAVIGGFYSFVAVFIGGLAGQGYSILRHKPCGATKSS